MSEQPYCAAVPLVPVCPRCHRLAQFESRGETMFEVVPVVCSNSACCGTNDYTVVGEAPQYVRYSMCAKCEIA